MSLPLRFIPERAEAERRRKANFDAAVRYHQKGKLAAAKKTYEQILAEHPGDLDSLNNLAAIHADEGDHTKALTLLSEAASRDSTNPTRLVNVGQVLNVMKLYDQALEAFRLALRLNPREARAYHYMGAVYRNMERMDEAEAHVLKALALTPDYADALDNLGAIYTGLNRVEEAIPFLEKAVRLNPKSYSAWNNLGNALIVVNRVDDACEAYRKAVALQPQNPDCHFHLAMALLHRGDLIAGWREFEWRFKGTMLSPVRRPYMIPQWEGSPAQRTLILHGEQGFGDTLQFCRYAPLVAARGHRVFLEVQPSLVRVVAHSLEAENLTVIPWAADFPGVAGTPEADAQIPLMSLPRIFGTTLDNIPNAPYLRAEAEKITEWRARLAKDLAPGLRIGLVWAGNPRKNFSINIRATDARRSLSLAHYLPLLETQGCRFVSLQKGEAAGQAAAGAALYDPTADLNDFADTAALIANLDLVVTVDTSVAHLAGGMGKTVWMLSRIDACWRWLDERSDTPWYPTMRIFRQGAERSWDRVVAEVAEALAARAANPSGK